MLDSTAVTFISRRDSQFGEYPPASANYAVIVPFFGDLTVWIRARANGGWQFPAGSRNNGETIGEAAKRQLWDATRLSAPRLALLGCLTRTDGARPRVAYVYACRVDRLSWTYEKPEDSVEVGVFVDEPRPIAGEWCRMLLEVARKALNGV